VASDLTDEEQERVRVALRFLQIRFGMMKLLAKALRLQPSTVIKVLAGDDNVSALMVLRVARLARVGLDDLLAGKYPVKGMCPHCGQIKE
jgi:ABC-type enterobactin transport system permease subunit